MTSQLNMQAKKVQYRSVDTAFEIDVIDITDDTVTFCQAGGGFVRKMSTTDLELHFKKIEERVMVECISGAEFYTDDDDNFLELKCYSDGQLWNGFGIPFVEPAELEKFINTLNAQAGDDEFKLSIDNNRFYYISEEDADGSPNYVPLSQIAVGDKTVSGYLLDIGWVFDRCKPVASIAPQPSSEPCDGMKPWPKTDCLKFWDIQK